MPYKKNNQKTLDMNLFKNPTSEYRGAPFWSWNGKLEKECLEKQIECFKEMGFGGFFMHPRYGLETEYLSEEYFEAIKKCIDTAEQNRMNANLYDEDRWPSGFAGGLVTKEGKYRQRVLCITANEALLPEFSEKEQAIKEGKPYLIACFDVEFTKDGYLKSYRKIDFCDKALHNKYYAYSRTEKPSGRYNFQTNVDLMQKEAIGKFIEVTHNQYFKRFGDRYGNTVPTIFSDEPRQGPAEQIEENPLSEGIYNWTFDFDNHFKKEYGYDIIGRLPKLVWDEKDVYSYERYDYFNLTTKLFEEAFFKQIHNTTEKQGLQFCGHLMLENDLLGALRWGGDIMRLYKHFDIPGIDMLFDFIEFVTAKQTQSIVRQYGKEAMLSELYGVTGWDYDFKCLKMQGDWQAAVGVSVRVPHLAMYSMKGGAKRDYPQSFNYQAPWYKEYKYLEDHYARLNTVLSRGKDLVDVAVIHPHESLMLAYSTKEKSGEMLLKMEKHLQKFCADLLYANIDFDFLNETELVCQKADCTEKLNVGKCSYSAVVVPPVITMRETTVKLLEKFVANGGKVIFTGECPNYLDGKISDRVKTLYKKAEFVKEDKLIDALEEYRRVKITAKGTENKKIYRLINDGEDYWLYAAHAERIGKTSPERRVTIPTKTVIEVKGEFGVTVYNTLNGTTEKADYEIKNGNTYIYRDWYANDCLLVKLTKEMTDRKPDEVEPTEYDTLLLENATYKRAEQNCVVLDMCETSVDGKDYTPKKYIIEQNKLLVSKLGFKIEEAQPYYVKNLQNFDVQARFEFVCEDELCGLSIALERAEVAKIFLNGKEIATEINGYYVDYDIKTVSLPKTKKGKNILEVLIPINSIRQLEPCYILGKFESKLDGQEIVLKQPTADKIDFKAITEQGMTFYGGNISYKSQFECEKCTAEIIVDNFGAPCVRVLVDGDDVGLIAFAPFSIKVPLSKGTHEIEFLCYGNRNNTFGPIHNSNIDNPNYYVVPLSWDNENEFFTEEFHFQETGILSKPIIKFYK